MLSGIAGLKCKLVKNVGQHLQALFTGAEISTKFHCVLCKNPLTKTLDDLCKSCRGSADLQLCY
jgi:hypothetical protein